jgi:hypothetical protein
MPLHFRISPGDEEGRNEWSLSQLLLYLREKTGNTASTFLDCNGILPCYQRLWGETWFGIIACFLYLLGEYCDPTLTAHISLQVLFSGDETSEFTHTDLTPLQLASQIQGKYSAEWSGDIQIG